MKIVWYKLEGDTPVPVDYDEVDLVNRWQLVTKIGKTKISTVFLAISHNGDDEHPFLFETMVFGGVLNGGGARYTTKALAEEGHERWVEMVRDLPDEP